MTEYWEEWGLQLLGQYVNKLGSRAPPILPGLTSPDSTTKLAQKELK